MLSELSIVIMVVHEHGSPSGEKTVLHYRLHEKHWPALKKESRLLREVL